MHQTNNKSFYKKLLTLALPILLQSLVTSSLNLVDNLMIGQLGEVSIAAVGLGNQIYFLANLFMMGVCGGTSIFFAQYWGKKDLDSIHKTMGLGLMLTVIIGTIFTLSATIFPSFVMRIYSKDILVIEEGTRYLRIAALSYMPYAISCIFITVLRSTGRVKIPLFVSVIALGMNTILNYALIFGNFGMPEMGVKGAAIATLTARMVEAILILTIVYVRKYDIGGKINELFSFSSQFFKHIMRKISFVMMNEGLWAIGTTCYSIVYARMGTDIVAAMNISGTLFNLIFIFALGIGSAVSIMIGNSLGADQYDQAKEYAKKGIKAAVICGVIVAGLMLLARDSILSLYSIQPEVLAKARTITNFSTLILPINCIEFTLFIGILRAGGDTKFCTYVDIGALWVVGLPLAVLGAFVFHLPLVFVYLLARTESLTRVVLCYLRYRSNRWVNNVT